MTLGWMIFWAGLGTFALRSVGVWVEPRWLQAKWLEPLPFAVMLVMVVASIAGLTLPMQDVGQGLGAIAATGAVTVAAINRVPLLVCILLGCAIYGALATL